MCELAYQLEGDRLKLDGLLSVETVSHYQPIGSKAIEAAQEGLTVDLEAADIVGSAAIALMISWQRRALAAKKSFSIVNAPEHFLNMAKLSGVRDILPFEVSGAN